MRLFFTLFFFLTVCNILAQRTTAIKCGHLLDVRSGQMMANKIIIVNDNRIASVLDATDFIPKTDSFINLGNAYVLPGLIDCHTHVLLQGDITAEDYYDQILRESIPYRTLRAVKSCRQSLMNGFTTIRDLGTEGAGYADADLKKAIHNGIIPGPRMFIATLAINTTGHYLVAEKDFAWQLNMPKGLQEITGADEARKATREQIAHGADWVKIYADRGYYKLPNGEYHSLPNFTTEEISAIADETRKSRKQLAAHAVTPDGVLYSIRAGARSIEHGYGMNDSCLKLMAQQQVFWCPTIYVNEFVAEGRLKAGSPMNKYFTETEPVLFRKAMQYGVKIAYGTDIGGYDWAAPQARDLDIFVRYGMSPLQAIQTATINAAELLEQKGMLGEIVPGAFADIIAVKENPLQNINILNTVQWVMKDGTVWKNEQH